MNPSGLAAARPDPHMYNISSTNKSSVSQAMIPAFHRPLSANDNNQMRTQTNSMGNPASLLLYVIKIKKLPSLHY